VGVDPLEQGFRHTRRGVLQTERGPAPGQRTQMHEIETGAGAETGEPIFDSRFLSLDFRFRLHRLQAGEGEDGVVKVRTSGAVHGAAFRGELAGEEGAHQVGGVAEDLWRDPRDLQHLQAKTHERDD